MIRTKIFKPYDLLIILANVLLYLALTSINVDIINAYVIVFVLNALFLIANNFVKILDKMSGVVNFIIATESAIANLLILEIFLR